MSAGTLKSTIMCQLHARNVQQIILKFDKICIIVLL